MSVRLCQSILYGLIVISGKRLPAESKRKLKRKSKLDYTRYGEKKEGKGKIGRKKKIERKTHKYIGFCA